MIKIRPQVIDQPVMRFAPGLRETLIETVCRFEPEHYAVLGVRQDDPFRVVEVRPMPPLQGNSSRSHVQLNQQFIEYYLNVELLRRGLYIGGIFHTHPGGFNRLSGGAAGSGQGDIPSMRAMLERARTIGGHGRTWTDFLAPIATMDANWTPTFTGWTVRLDQADPIATQIKFETAPAAPAIPADRPLHPIDEWLAIGSQFQGHANRVLADRLSPKEHREWMAGFIHQAMRDELTARKARFQASAGKIFNPNGS